MAKEATTKINPVRTLEPPFAVRLDRAISVTLPSAAATNQSKMRIIECILAAGMNADHQKAPNERDGPFRTA
jgi:hypothetical protein